MAKRKEAKAASQLPARYGRPDPEINDEPPLEMPLGACRPEPLQSIIARMVRTSIQEETGEQFETEEEADDFEIEGDLGILDMSPYTLEEVEPELDYAPEPPPEAVEEAISQDVSPPQGQESVAPSEGAG